MSSLSTLLLFFTLLFAPPATTETEQPTKPVVIETPDSPVPIVIQVKSTTPVEASTWELPNVCDTYELVYRRGKRHPYYRKIKHKVTKEDRVRAKKLARLVAREMGADYRLLWLWISRGSSGNPHTIHILNSDRKADWRAWRSYQWSPDKEKRYRDMMQKYGAQDSRFWWAKHRLAKIQVYKSNPWFDDTFDVKIVDGEYTGKTEHPYFAMKYGPLDMSAVGYTKIWSREAPPWIMCNDDGLIAYITAIWAMRDFQSECKSQVDHGDGAGVIDRRYARGHCLPASKNFVKRAKVYKIDPNKRYRLGKRWPRKTTDRKEIWEYMKRRAVETGIWSNSSTDTQAADGTESSSP